MRLFDGIGSRWMHRNVAVLRWIGGAALVASALALVVDRWYAAVALQAARDDVARELLPLASSLRSAMDRRLATLQALQSFAYAQPTRARLEEEFPTFAEGLSSSLAGIRALQYAENGRIVVTWPLQGNERMLGYDLLSDPRPEMRDGVRRALAGDGPVITGPLQLLQGGAGLIVRARMPERTGFPTLATIVLDVPQMIERAGIPDRRTRLLLAVHDQFGRWAGGDTVAAGSRPLSVPVEMPGGNWSLRGAPEEGWLARARPRQVPVRVASAASWFAIVLVGALLGLRQARAALALAERSARLGVALRAQRMGTWEFDVLTDHYRFDPNASRILGIGAGETVLTGAQVYGYIHPDDVNQVSQVFFEVLASGLNDYALEHRVVLSDGTERWVLVLGEVQRDEKGRAEWVIGVLSDASARRAAEHQARQLERVESLGAMTGGIVHDFNNLLTALIAFTEIARDGIAKAKDAEQRAVVLSDLDEVLKVAARARGLVAQLLSFGRGQSSEPEAVDVSSMVAQVEPMLLRLIGPRVSLAVVAAPDVPPVWMPPAQLTQVLLNLIVNARDAVQGRGQVELRVQYLRAGESRPRGGPSGDWVLLQVRDNGTGMTDEVRRRLFEPFFTTKGSERGTGLGLSVVLSVVRAAGGHIDVNSTPGVGTTFSVFLPPRFLDARSVTPSAGTPTHTAESGSAG